MEDYRALPAADEIEQCGLCPLAPAQFRFPAVVVAHDHEIVRRKCLRAGAAIARPDILEKIKPYSAGAMPVTGMVGATASLKVKNLVPERRKIMGDNREDTFNFLTAKNVEFISSESN